MLSERARAEMRFYANTGDYSDPERYEQFAFECNLNEKAFEIGRIVRSLVDQMPHTGRSLDILETASATGLTAVGVGSELARAHVEHIYTSLDIEPNLLKFARWRSRGDQFVQGSFERLPFTDNSFDIYIMMGAEWYRTTGRFYPEVYRVLRSGGYYVMPQIGPRPIVRTGEINTALRSGLSVVQADNFLITQKN